MILNLALGLALSALIAALAYKRGSLARSGAVGALLVGTAIFGFGGWVWGILLIAFFVTSSALSHFKEREKQPLAEKFQKGHRRDLGQVLANGGLGALLAIAHALYPRPALFFAFVGAMASVTADTWATELGVLSRQPPRLITTLRPVAVGTSGGISLLGTTVALLGAFFIGALGLALVLLQSLFSPAPLLPCSLALPLIASISGLAGSLFDSLLGATVQAIYYCDYDQKETESALHRCGRATRLIRGWRWLDNDGVNFAASVFGSALAVAMYWVIR
jgi:uncharacterized protein (TIGR00297 family)